MRCYCQAKLQQVPTRELIYGGKSFLYILLKMGKSFGSLNSSALCGIPNTLTQEQRDLFVDTHNELRATLQALINV